MMFAVASLIPRPLHQPESSLHMALFRDREGLAEGAFVHTADRLPTWKTRLRPAAGPIGARRISRIRVREAQPKSATESVRCPYIRQEPLCPQPRLVYALLPGRTYHNDNGSCTEGLEARLFRMAVVH